MINNPIVIVSDILKLIPVLSINEKDINLLEKELSTYDNKNNKIEDYKKHIKNSKTREAFDNVIKELKTNTPIKNIADSTGLSVPTLYRLLKDLELNNIRQYITPYTYEPTNKKLKQYNTYMINYNNKIIEANDSINFKNGKELAIKHINRYGIYYSIYYFMGKVITNDSDNFINGYNMVLNNKVNS